MGQQNTFIDGRSDPIQWCRFLAFIRPVTAFFAPAYGSDELSAAHTLIGNRPAPEFKRLEGFSAGAPKALTEKRRQ